MLDLSRRKLHYVALKGKAAHCGNGVITRLESYPFSFGELQNRPIKETIIELAPKDRLYLYTDGVYDQKGGPRDRRWGSRSWMEFLKDIQSVPFLGQRESIEEAISAWQKDHPQTDDILVVGLEVV